MKVSKHLHHHRCWTNDYWHSYRDEVLRVWSRVNLEGRNVLWTNRDVLPSVIVKGEIEYGNARRWTSEAKALLEAILWKNCC